MIDDEKSFEYEGTTYRYLAKRKNKHRTAVRRAARILEEAGYEREDTNEFTCIVGFTLGADGKGWKPPAPDAKAADIRAGYNDWLENGDTDLTDAFMAAFFPDTDSATAPAPPTDPNA